MIESWWRILIHQWLYLNTLDFIAAVERLVGFYVNEHNTWIPHSAFQGQTPDEIYFGRGFQVPEQLAKAREQARIDRIAANRASTGSFCQNDTHLQNIVNACA